MRVACFLVTHLRAKVEMQRRPYLRNAPAVIVDRERGRAVVLDALPGASGASAGMTLEEALSLRPGDAVVEADEPAYRSVFRQALVSLQGVSDRVEAGELGTAYVRLDGLFDMYGGEARLAVALLNAAPGYLLPAASTAGRSSHLSTMRPSPSGCRCHKRVELGEIRRSLRSLGVCRKSWLFETRFPVG